MATELARSLTPEELVAKSICPIKKEFIANGTQARKQLAVIGGSSSASQAPKKSLSQLKKEKKKAKDDQICFHFIRGTCTFGSGCKYKHDLTEYVKSRPKDLPGECPFSCMPKCPYGVSCRWATKHKTPDELTQKWLLDNPDVVSDTNGNAVKANEREQQTSVLEAQVLPTADEILTPKNHLSNLATHDLRTRTYDFAAADAALRALGVSNNLKLKDKKVKPGQQGKGRGSNKRTQAEADGSVVLEPAVRSDPDLPAVPSTAPDGVEQNGAVAQAEAVHADDTKNEAPAVVEAKSLVAAPVESEAQASAAESKPAVKVDQASTGQPADKATKVQGSNAGAQAVKKQRTDATGDATIPIYDISKASNTEGGVLHRDGAKRIDFSGKLYCAPLTTNGNLPFRRVVKGFGCDVTCGEMALTANLLSGQQSEWALLKRHPCEDLFGVQICGAHPDSVARCVQLLDDNIDVDFIDLNMGCPIDLICNKGMGSALMNRPRRMASLVEAASAVAKHSAITFKMRTGYYDKRNAVEVLSEAGKWGAAAVTIHGRTRQQRYSKSADWSYIELCGMTASKSMQVIGNGDVFSWTDYDEHMRDSTLSTCMVARGALIKPWIFTEIKERRHWDITAGERLDMLKEYCKFGLEHWGSDKQGVENTRRFLLEWLSFLCRYVPVGLLEVVPQQMTWRPPAFVGRSDLETLLGSTSAQDWVRITEMLLGPAPEGFNFVPKHRSNAYDNVKNVDDEGEVQG